MMNAKPMRGHAAAGLALAAALFAGSAVAGEATVFADRNFQGQSARSRASKAIARRFSPAQIRASERASTIASRRCAK